MNKKKNSAVPAPTVQDFPIVGVGASAGGLEAFKQLLEAIPEDSGMAFVLVQHLYPSHDSILPEILSKFTKIPVFEITDDIHLAPNNIYVIPENKILISTDGILSLSPRNKEVKNAVIDIFFKTLAEVHLDLAVGIVLTGMGTDGTMGLIEIKNHGGITFAQDEETAEYDQMPLSAVNAQAVDFVMSPQEIPEKLIEIFNIKKNNDGNQNNVEDEEDAFREIILLLHKSNGVDFTYYKPNTIRRRIARRMAISKAKNLADYLKILREDKAAPTILFNDLLIPVTSFFRDSKVFTEIKLKIFPALINKKSNTNSIRIWVAGCSTGAEAYSLAIALNEFLGKNNSHTEIRIFGSDISEISIAKARIGFYKKIELSTVPQAYLKKYFTEKEDGYQINAQIRDLCVFAVHNFLKDPPFARMDMITCRNVLIYMDIFLQKKALTTFHYALSDEGFLVLGKSETTAQASELYMPLLIAEKIFTRKPTISRQTHQAMREKEVFLNTLTEKKTRKEVLKTDFIKSAQNLLLSDYSPASVVIDEHLDIVHINGDIAPFLQLAQGKPTFNLLKIAREGLVFELRNTIHKAKEANATIVKEGISIKFNAKTIAVNIEVRPLPDTADVYFLVLFQKMVVPNITSKSNGAFPEESNNATYIKRIEELERELLQTQADVNSITDDNEASNEELQSANEELLSGSEELQILNEELETSKEELQSSNEELININEELLHKQEVINISKTYTETIIATLREPFVVLDTNLRIKNTNRAFTKKYNIEKEEARGKLIYEIQNHLFKDTMMQSVLEKVLSEKKQLDDFEISINFQPYGESIMLLNARRVTNEESKEQLILLAIDDITERKIIERNLQTLSDGFEAKVKQRTAELEASNEELATSLEELLQANIRLHQFAYIASHDLQEPLRKILTFISILKDQYETLPKDVVALLTKISKSSERMKTLIEDLLAYSYLSNDDALFVTTDLNDILKNVLIDFELLIGENGVEVTSSKLPVVNAIPLQMNQLFYNLISNSLKFGKKENPKIKISSSVMTASKLTKYPSLNPDLLWYEIVFEDNGIGFDQKYEKQIFTIFQRLHSKDTYKGTGIGLAISHKIMENHGGVIFANAKPNEGAKFHIILPALANKKR